MKKISENTQDGELLLRNTALKEWGLLIGDGGKITQSIYWDTKQDMICDVEKILEFLMVVDKK